MVYDSLKANGFGHGYFEYTLTLPKGVGANNIKSAQLRFEASAKELFGKDVKGGEAQGSYMLGEGTFDHCKSPNAYAMTDTLCWTSHLKVSVNGQEIADCTLDDDPADHRGILSWASQPTNRLMSEAGSYGQLFRLDVPTDAFDESRTATIRFTVPDDCEGGLAIYGKDFGRYPLDPTLVLTLK